MPGGAQKDWQRAAHGGSQRSLTNIMRNEEQFVIVRYQEYP